MTTVGIIIRAYLEKNGYDGLCHPDYTCGCGLDDLCPDECDVLSCQPAYRRKATKKEAAYWGIDEGDDIYTTIKEVK